MTEEQQYMKQALALAERGCGWVSPNPMVGAVIVKDGRIIGRGWHQNYGGLHAERNALADCAEDPKDAEMYVTLEPCCHYGKTPPCTEAIVQSGIRRVVIGSSDPNPLVRGKGAAALRAHGILVKEGVLKNQCDKLNAIFFHYITTRTPYVTLKYAMTLDGKIATATGQSRWITGEAAREQVHRDRHRHSAIMVGVGTVLADDPALTCRTEGGRNPVRIVCDTRLSTPVSARVVQTAAEISTILVTAEQDASRCQPFLEAGCTVLHSAVQDGQIDLKRLMPALGTRGIDSILLEGGAAMHWSALRAGIVNRVQAYIAPKIFGGAGAKTPVGGNGVLLPGQGFRLEQMEVERFGEDLRIEGEVVSCLPES